MSLKEDFSYITLESGLFSVSSQAQTSESHDTNLFGKKLDQFRIIFLYFYLKLIFILKYYLLKYQFTFLISSKLQVAMTTKKCFDISSLVSIIMCQMHVFRCTPVQKTSTYIQRVSKLSSISNSDQQKLNRRIQCLYPLVCLKFI